jgi:Helicase conserved C-terminal domain
MLGGRAASASVEGMTTSAGTASGRPRAAAAAGGAATLSAWLRARSDGELAALLAARPDLATPPPADFAVLSSRVAIKVSVLRALERVDLFCVQVCQVMCLLAPPGGKRAVSVADLIAFCAPGGGGEATATEPAGADLGTAIRAAVARLRNLALVWGPDDHLRLVGAVADTVGDYPLGLGRPVRACLAGHQANQLRKLVSAAVPATAEAPAGAPDREAMLEQICVAFTDRDHVQALIDACSETAQGVLGRLAAGPPLGATAEAPRLPPVAAARTAVEELLARSLLVGVAAETVELPREVGLVLRGGHPAGAIAPYPPPLEGKDLGEPALAGSCALAAAEFVRHVEVLAEAWGAQPVAPLRAGGLGVRDLRATARLLDVPDAVAALVVEVAEAAGFIDLAAGPDAAYVPTAAYDRWCTDDLPRRWAVLAQAWFDMPKVAALVGDRDDRGKVMAALSYATHLSFAPRLRRAVLTTLAEAPAGVAPDRSSVLARIAWRAPQWGGPLFDKVITATFDEAATLGVIGRGGLPAPGRALAAGHSPWPHSEDAVPRQGGPTTAPADPDEPAGPAIDAVARALAPLLPDPVEEIIFQADLTAIAPGPLVPELAAELAELADVESTGAATVYRISESSVRRALDEGRTAGDLHAFLERVARPGVPPALTYLVDDVARRHGVLRTGPATSYLRCDDTGLLSEVVAARGTRTLGLRRIAPTVAISSHTVPELLEGLRAAGYAPAPEGPDGRIVLSRTPPHRAPGRGRPAWIDPAGARSWADLVALIRRGDDTSHAARLAGGAAAGPGGPATSGPAILVALADAARNGSRVLLGYVDQDGMSTQRIVAPTTVGGGYLMAWDERDGATRRFVLHRVTSTLELAR